MKKLLTPDATAVGRPGGPGLPDAVGPAREHGTPGGLKTDLIRLLGRDQVLHRVLDLVRYASDASPYRLLPQVVVQPRDVGDIVRVIGLLPPVRPARHVPRRRDEPEWPVAVR